MALSNDERARVAELLDAHPEWRTGQIREAAGLNARQLFAVKSLRQELGVPEPDGGAPKKSTAAGTARRGRKPATARLEAQDLPDPDEVDAMRSGAVPKPGRTAGKGFRSILAPVMPTAIVAGATGLMNVSGRLTRNPMTQPEAAGIAAPLARIADRFLAKYIKVTSGKLTPDAEDARDALLTLGLYVLRLMADNVAQRAAHRASSTPPAMGPMAHTPVFHMPPAPMPESDGGDLFAGSEPAMAPAPSRADAPTPTAAPSRRPVTSDGARLAAEGIAGPESGPVDESYWQAITPTNLGNYEAP